MLEDVVRLAGRVKDQSSRVDFLADISQILYGQGDRQRGDKLFSQAIKAAGRIREGLVRVHALQKLTSWLCSTASRSGCRQMKVAFDEAEKKLAREVLNILNR
jgi:hypothetical protein